MDQVSTKTRANELMDTLNKLANQNSVASSSPIPNKQPNQPLLQSSGQTRHNDYDSRASQISTGTGSNLSGNVNVMNGNRNPSSIGTGGGGGYKSSADIRRAAAVDLMDYNQNQNQNGMVSNEVDHDNRGMSLIGNTKKR